jgi:hypothetical protein
VLQIERAGDGAAHVLAEEPALHLPQRDAQPRRTMKRPRPPPGMRRGAR